MVLRRLVVGRQSHKRSYGVLFIVVVVICIHIYVLVYTTTPMGMVNPRVLLDCVAVCFMVFVAVRLHEIIYIECKDNDTHDTEDA